MGEEDRPEGVKEGATLSEEWNEKGYHCQIWADYKYYAGVIEGEKVAEAVDTVKSAVVKEMRKDLEYREHKWRKSDVELTYDEYEEIPEEYQCPLCVNRKFTDISGRNVAEDLFDHLKEQHPSKVFGR